MRLMKRAVGGVHEARAASLLSGRRPPSLAGWYGDILTREQATGLQAAAQRVLQHRLCEGRPGFRPRLLQLICGFWLEAEVDLAYGSLAATAGNEYDRALLELVFGQLLISRKCRRALPHLQAGFRLAAGHLVPADYFRLVRRHELLVYIGLRDSPAPAQRLETLLAEAAVIERLRARDGRHYEHMPHDIVG
jgi:hypothetical protein